MMSLNYCLSRSAHGDPGAAYEAAKIMYLEAYNDLMVQAQLRKAASLGNVDAMRCLGFLGLSGKLIVPKSSITNVSYYDTYAPAYEWFLRGAKKGDVLSAFALGSCLQHGIGTTQDTQKAERIMSAVTGSVSADAIMPIVLLINALAPLTATADKPFDSSIIEKILDAKNGKDGEKH